MTELPTFFFSHARQDRETPGKWLVRFFEDLEIKVAQWAGIVLKERRLGTIDTRVQQGENWDADLCRSLTSDNTFVAVLTPLYFNRPNCGKELAVFLMRCPELGIDENGALTGVRNVIPIRWLPENAYTSNTTKDSLIPPILRLIEDTPADDGRDTDRTLSIERYRRKGMERCVNSQPHYGELLDLFVERIRDMASLPPASTVSFATAKDAFRHDWRGHLTSSGSSAALPAVPQPPDSPVAPRALASIVAFYVTTRQFTPDPNAVDFADSLVAETPSDSGGPYDVAFHALLADVRHAGVAEGFNVFHAVGNPVVPASPGPLLARLSSLSKLGVLTALIVEPSVWPGTGPAAVTVAVEQIIRSLAWIGPVLLPRVAGPAVEVDELVALRGLPPRLVALPESSEERVTALRRAFIDSRGRLLRTGTERSGDAETIPVLKGVSAERQ